MAVKPFVAAHQYRLVVCGHDIWGRAHERVVFDKPVIIDRDGWLDYGYGAPYFHVDSVLLPYAPEAYAA